MFRDEIENLLYNISDFEKGARNKTINSRGRARILDANSRETFRDREFSPMSEGDSHYFPTQGSARDAEEELSVGEQSVEQLE